MPRSSNGHDQEITEILARVRHENAQAPPEPGRPPVGRRRIDSSNTGWRLPNSLIGAVRAAARQHHMRPGVLVSSILSDSPLIGGVTDPNNPKH
jgi:hypothetical protein